MDPVSALLTNYILAISSNLQTSYRVSAGLDITPVIIQHNNIDVNFQHQLWKIKDNTVCALYQQDASNFSQCTVAAKSLFTEICRELSSKKNQNSLYNKHRNMYCNASIKYQPVIATISAPRKSKLAAKEKKCNELILQAMNRKDKEVIEARDRACNES